jgi:TrmH family RNA methyltransferase
MLSNIPHASQNQLKRWAKLLDAKFRLAEGLFLAEGVKVVEELLKSDRQAEALLVLPEKISVWGKTIREAKSNVPTYQLTRPEWKKLSQDREPEGLMAVVCTPGEPSVPSFLQSSGGHILILHEINNPGNLGALIRSACWFGFSGILLSSNSVDWTNPKAVRASMGGVFSLTILSNIDIAALLPELRRDYVLVGSDAHQGTAPRALMKKAALLLGSESHGLSDSLLRDVHERWRIPGGGGTESLSLPQAAAIMMYKIVDGVPRRVLDDKRVDGG